MTKFFSGLLGDHSSCRPTIKVTTFIVLLSLYYGFVLNYPIVSKIFSLSSDIPDVWFPYTAPLVLFCAFIVVFTLLAVPYLMKPFMVILTLSSAVALYAELTYHILFDVSMIENVVGTNTSEISFYLNLRSFLYILVFGISPSLLICWVKVEFRETLWKEISSRIILVLLALVSVSLIAVTSYKDYAAVGRNNSYLNKMIIPGHAYNTYQYIQKNYLTKPLPYVSLGDDAKLAPSKNKKPTLVIFVLGETARSMNFEDNGYHRDTQPYTKKLGLVSFNHVSSCGTYTALSVPCMFSNMERIHYNKAKANAQDNALDIIAKSGVETLWVDNDGGDKGVAKRTKLIKIDPKEDSTLCNGETCFDEVMLKHTNKFIQSNNKDKLIVLHSIGSHGPTYFQRFPAEKAKFAPWCNSKDIEQCTDQEITNVYDNTLVYTDYFLSQVVKTLQQYSGQYNVAMMYMSDHGESLGENGMYLHGTPYALAPKEQKMVPWMMWVPQQYATQKHIDVDCLKREAQKTHYSQDNFFHSLIGFYGVDTQEKQTQMDVFSTCQVKT
ncbi:phosphoethanolamine transferase [Vibrio rumoiensis]|uniref:Phosphoethanolamine transferase n=1 Tax=Vibrio rumoiensis 1S-45 TaxID=1188252 RepID=A0A1E5E262_9VIBR|nr:phosphoethanolamine--lipid A transferase [Vibrio rumoiensis]OEF25517.1 phosphoethanolamine transferase [Vibrio rumoiensis 1S-45]